MTIHETQNMIGGALNRDVKIWKNAFALRDEINERRSDFLGI